MLLYYTSPWIPPEWIQAHGLEPRGLWCADLKLHRLPLCQGVCPFAESCVGFARFHREAGFIFDSTCDQMRRSFDLLVSELQERMFLFNIPATWQSPAARGLYRAELERLGKWMQKLGGCSPDDECLRRTFEQYRRARRQLLAAASRYSARDYAEAVAQLYWNGALELTQLPRCMPKKGPRLALIGGPLPASQWHLLDMIEEGGGQVVLNATAAGERSLAAFSDADIGPGDPFEGLASSYFESGFDVFQRPNSRLFNWLREQIAARQVQGIVLWTYVGCDLWRAEAQTCREVLDLPVCQLEADGLGDGSASQASRIQAFLELLG